MSDLKQLAVEIAKETLAAIDIASTMRRKWTRNGSQVQWDGQTVDLAEYDRILAVAVGKAAVAMARGFAELLGGDLAFEGIVIAPHPSQAQVAGFRAFGAGHPIPDDGSLMAARAVIELLSHSGLRTIVFFLLSGGGSSLIELPLDSRTTLEDLRQLNGVLVHCGASIHEINTVRKHVSALKGGRLAVLARDAMKVTLAITDVPAGFESALASGPTLPDPTTVADAVSVIDKYGIDSHLPPSIRAFFAHPESVPETPKPGDPAFARAHFSLLLTMGDLFHHAHRAAETRGFLTHCDNLTDDWPVSRAAEYLLAELAQLSRANCGRCVAVIADGELSSPVHGDGIGGRNSAFVLDCVERIARKRIAVVSLGTDGKDGSSPAAGAVADGETLARAQAVNLSPEEFAARSDSYTFFRQLGDAIETGPTGNNLRDLRIVVAE